MKFRKMTKTKADAKTKQAISGIQTASRKIRNVKDVKDALKKTDKMREENKTTYAKFKEQIDLLYNLLKDVCKGDYTLSVSTICIFTAVLLYVVSPIDLIPDVIPVVGVVDDAGVIAWFISAFADELEEYKKFKNSRK